MTRRLVGVVSNHLVQLAPDGRVLASGSEPRYSEWPPASMPAEFRSIEIDDEVAAEQRVPNRLA